jgi:Holliday junction resolvase
MSSIKYKTDLGSKLKKAAASPDSSKLHVIAKNNGWIVKKEGAQRAQKAYKLKKEAVEGALITVRKGEAKAVIVHKKDGTIEAWKH